jgi:transposase-like protein
MVKGDGGAFELEVPRDRDGSFEPRLVGKGQTRIDGLDEKIIAMYARGMSVRDIRGHLEELYGLEVSPDLPPGTLPRNALPGSGSAVSPTPFRAR